MKRAIDLKTIEQKLLAQRKELAEGVVRAREMGAVQEESGAPDIADRASSAFTREFSFAVSENESKMLQLIDEALSSIKQGKYGTCTHCGENIEVPRLQAIPWARHCISCQELQDRGEI